MNALLTHADKLKEQSEINGVEIAPGYTHTQIHGKIPDEVDCFDAYIQ